MSAEQAKLREILGEQYGTIQEVMRNWVAQGLQATNETVIQQIDLYCSNPDQVARELRALDSAGTKLVDLLVPPSSSPPVLPLQPQSALLIDPPRGEDRKESRRAKEWVESKSKAGLQVPREEPAEGIAVHVICHTDRAMALMQNVWELFGEEKLCAAFSKALNFFAEKAKKGIIAESEYMNLREILVIDGNGKGQAVLIEQPFIYSLLPAQIDVKFSHPAEKMYKMPMRNVDRVTVEGDNKPVPMDEDRAKRESRQEQGWVRFLKHFAGIDFVSVTREEIAAAVGEARAHFIGIEDLSRNIQTELNGFATESFDLPKGFLFYGPPGTGKSAIIKYILDRLPFLYLCPPLAAGDFNKGIVGDSERMINQFARRAEIVPWELCALLVDEIDALAPNRMAAGAESHSINTLSVLLSVLDGAKATPNLKIFATTNKFEQMDEAFCRRLDKKMFVGRPDFDARAKWIGRMIAKVKRPEGRARATELMTKKRTEDLVTKTLNFSCDGMKKLLSRMLDDITYYKTDERRIDELILKALTDVCVSERVYFGQHILPRLIASLPRFVEDLRYGDLRNFYNFTNRLPKTQHATKRILIDLNADLQCQLQVEINRQAQMTEGQENFIMAATGMFEKQPMEGLTQLRAVFPDLGLPQYEDRDQRDTIKRKFASAIAKLKTLMRGETVLAAYQAKGGFESVETQVYPALVKFALEHSLGTVTLVDSHYFMRKEASEDSKAEVEVAYAVDEARKHTSAMVIFNLNSIAGLSKEYSGLRKDVKGDATAVESDGKGIGGPSLHYTMTRPKAFQQVLTEFADGKDLLGTKNVWLVVISEHDILTQHLKERAKWPVTQKEADARQKQEDAKEERKCELCHAMYTEGENDKNACGSHLADELYISAELEQIKAKEKDRSGTSFDELFKKVHRYSFAQAQELVLKRGYPASQFRWWCCDKGMYDKGEIPSPHVPKFD